MCAYIHFFDLRLRTFADIGIYQDFRLTNLRISAFIRNYMQSANIFRGLPMLAIEKSNIGLFLCMCSSMMHSKTKHIPIKYHFVRE